MSFVRVQRAAALVQRAAAPRILKEATLKEQRINRWVTVVDPPRDGARMHRMELSVASDIESQSENSESEDKQANGRLDEARVARLNRWESLMGGRGEREAYYKTPRRGAVSPENGWTLREGEGVWRTASDIPALRWRSSVLPDASRQTEIVLGETQMMLSSWNVEVCRGTYLLSCSTWLQTQEAVPLPSPCSLRDCSLDAGRDGKHGGGLPG